MENRQAIRRLSEYRSAPKGSILITALWAVALLTVFAVILGAQTRYKTALVARLEDADRLRYVAEAGVKKAAALVKEEKDNIYNSMMDPWSDDPQALRNVATDIGKFTVSYDYYYDRSRPPQTRYGLVDEERKLNINKCDLKSLKRLITLTTGLEDQFAQNLAASIIDWRDNDDMLSLPVGSAESRHYRSLSYPYESKNEDSEVLDELYMVNGMDEVIFDRLKEYLTVFGSGKINVNTAPKEVLLATGLSHALVDDILEIRMGHDMIIGTDDDGFFDSTSGIVTGLSRFTNLSEADRLALAAASEQFLTVSSSAFTVYSTATSKNGMKRSETVAVVNRNGKVLCWKES